MPTNNESSAHVSHAWNSSAMWQIRGFFAPGTDWDRGTNQDISKTIIHDLFRGYPSHPVSTTCAKESAQRNDCFRKPLDKGRDTFDIGRQSECALHFWDAWMCASIPEKIIPDGDVWSLTYWWKQNVAHESVAATMCRPWFRPATRFGQR